VDGRDAGDPAVVFGKAPRYKPVGARVPFAPR